MSRLNVYKLDVDKGYSFPIPAGPVELIVGRVVHFEIHADNPERAAAFYTALLGWKLTRWEGPMDYWMVFTGPDGTPGINGGMIRRQHPLSGQDRRIAYVCTVYV